MSSPQKLRGLDKETEIECECLACVDLKSSFTLQCWWQQMVSALLSVPLLTPLPQLGGITGLVKMNKTDLLINYTDHRGCVLITDKVFSVLGSRFRIIQGGESLSGLRRVLSISSAVSLINT